MKKLFLVEDDPSLGQTLKERLSREGYFVKWVASAEDAKQNFAAETWDLILFDVGLPDGDGFSLAKSWANKGIPFLFITALADAEHRLKGFELGAEEYIPKPFHLKELLLRVHHVLENHAQKKLLSIGDIEIDFTSQCIRSKKGIYHPPVKDFQVLALLIEKSPKALSRDEILDAVWGPEHVGNLRTVDNAIVRLRSLFEGENNPIRSVRGIGYQWETI